MEEMINASLDLLTQAQDLYAHMAQELAKAEAPVEEPVEEKTVAILKRV